MEERQAIGFTARGRGEQRGHRSLGIRLERAGAALREGRSSELPCEEKGRREIHKRRRKNSVRSPDCGIATLVPALARSQLGSGEDCGDGGRSVAGSQRSHMHSPILARLATRIHRATR